MKFILPLLITPLTVSTTWGSTLEMICKATVNEIPVQATFQTNSAELKVEEHAGDLSAASGMGMLTVFNGEETVTVQKVKFNFNDNGSTILLKKEKIFSINNDVVKMGYDVMSKADVLSLTLSNFALSADADCTSKNMEDSK